MLPFSVLGPEREREREREREEKDAKRHRNIPVPNTERRDVLFFKLKYS